MLKHVAVEAHDWVFIDYDGPDFPRHLPLFIGRVLAVSKKGRQFITWFDHETDEWDLSYQLPLAPDDQIIAWTQVSNPVIDDMK